MTAAYRDYGFHIRQSCIGMLIGLPAALAAGGLTAAAMCCPPLPANAAR